MIPLVLRYARLQKPYRTKEFCLYAKIAVNPSVTPFNFSVTTRPALSAVIQPIEACAHPEILACYWLAAPVTFTPTLCPYILILTAILAYSRQSLRLVIRDTPPQPFSH